MATIAFVQHRLGRTDGVSLEVDKWRSVLESLGHTVCYIAGNEDVPGGHVIPELYPFHPDTQRIIRNSTRRLEDYASGGELIRDIEKLSTVVERKMRNMILELGVDLLIPNNLLSVGYNSPAMLALSRILRDGSIAAICHHHDFWWEDSGEVYPTCEEIRALYRKHAPPTAPNCSHVVINRIACEELRRRRGIDATIVPNVFDFEQPSWVPDDYNCDFRNSFGIGDSDIVMLQATRILDRKAVELAIDVVAELSRPERRRRLESGAIYDGRRFGPTDRIILLCAGYVEGIGLSDAYTASLRAKAADAGVEVVWAGDRIRHSRGTDSTGAKTYSLWDAYVAADHVTYPSVWEGWGNQFIEAVFARLPAVVFEYPVWRSDLAAVGFEVASLGGTIAGHDARGLVTVSHQALDDATDRVMMFLTDGELRRRATERNFALARERFSLTALRTYVTELLAGADLQQNCHDEVRTPVTPETEA